MVNAKLNRWMYLGIAVLVLAAATASTWNAVEPITPLERDIVKRLNAGEAIPVRADMFVGFDKLCLANSVSHSRLPACNRAGTFLAAVSNDDLRCKTFSLDGIEAKVLLSDEIAECSLPEHKVLKIIVVAHDDYVTRWLDFSE